MNSTKISPADLIPLDIFEGDAPLRVDLAYAGPDSFCGVLYRPGARLWLHADLAAVVVLAAHLSHRDYGLSFVVYDGLRTVEAQALMGESAIVKAHPHWRAGPDRVISPPGMGGHPRAMAVDIGLADAAGALVDMGTAFDEMPANGSGPHENRAHRLYADLPEEAKHNRLILRKAMTDAASLLGLPLLPLPVEWWDFRFPADVTGRYEPLSDADLPLQMRMTGEIKTAPVMPDFSPDHFGRKTNGILQRIAPYL